MTARFRIGLSYSRAVQVHVEPVARMLAETFGRSAILFDRFHEAEFAHGNLAFTLPALYKNDCNLIVAIFDETYQSKEWTGLEWRAIFALLKEKDFSRVMLLSIGRQKPAELYDLDGTLDVSTRTSKEISTLILERLALNEGRDRTHYLPKIDQAEPAVSSEGAASSDETRIADALRDEIFYARRESNGRNRRKTLLKIASRTDLLSATNPRLVELRIQAWRHVLSDARHYADYMIALEGLHRAFESAISATVQRSNRWFIIRAVCEAAVDISQSAPGAIELNKIASHLNSAIKQIGSLLGLKPEAEHPVERHAEFLSTRAKCKRALATVLNRRTQASKEMSAKIKSLRQEALQDAMKAKDLVANEFTLHECALCLFSVSSSPNSENGRAGLTILEDLAKDPRNVLARYEYVRQLKLRHRFLDAMNAFSEIYGIDSDRRRFDANLSYFVGAIIGLYYRGGNPDAVKSASIDAINWLQEAISAEHHRAREIIDYCFMLAIAGYPIEQFTDPLKRISNGDSVDWNVIAQMSYHASRGEETLREALLLGLEDALLWSRMATLHLDFAKDYEKAIMFYDQAIHLDARSPMYHLNKARALAHGLNDYQSAKYSLAQARRLAKNMWGWFTVNQQTFDELSEEINEKIGPGPVNDRGM